MEDEDDDVKKEKYVREDEYSKSWDLATLGQHPSESVQGFFPASEFAVHRSFMEKRGPLHWPSYVQLSSDHTHPRWRFSSHHRLKNVIVTLEYTPDMESSLKTSAQGAGAMSAAAGAASMAVAALSDGQKHRLSRVFQMYDTLPSPTPVATWRAPPCSSHCATWQVRRRVARGSERREDAFGPLRHGPCPRARRLGATGR